MPIKNDNIQCRDTGFGVEIPTQALAQTYWIMTNIYEGSKISVRKIAIKKFGKNQRNNIMRYFRWNGELLKRPGSPLQKITNL
jgi:hypothetical protein